MIIMNIVLQHIAAGTVGDHIKLCIVKIGNIIVQFGIELVLLIIMVIVNILI